MLRSRSALTITAISAVALLAAAICARPVYLQIQQDAAVASIERPRCRANWNRESPFPIWSSGALNRIGVNRFTRVVGAQLTEYARDPHDADSLKSLPFLRHLEIRGFLTPTVRGTALLDDLPELEDLHLSGFGFQTGWLLKIRRCRKLQEVRFDGIPLGDLEITDLPSLSKLELRTPDPSGRVIPRLVMERLPALRTLNVYRDLHLVKDGAFKVGSLPGLEIIDVQQVPLRSVELSGAPNLIQLEIRTTKLTDQGIASLHGLKRLQLLRLVVCDITDTGLQNLADLPALEILDLRYTSVTANGLAGLGRFKRLNTVITNADLTFDELLELRRALPGVIIHVVKREHTETFDQLSTRLRDSSR
jgi:hypothetical protein